MTDRLSRREKLFRFVDQHGECSSKDIAVGLDIPMSSVYLNVKELKAGGWLESGPRRSIRRSRSKGNLFVIVGPSGTGKSTLAELLRASGMPVVVSMTTRPMRKGEIAGYDYHFVSKETFALALANKALVESAFYNGNHYGISKGAIEACLAAGDSVVITEAQGAMALKRAFPCCFVVFLHPPFDTDELRQRLISRGDTEKQVEARMKSLPREVEAGIQVADLLVWPDEPESIANLILGVRGTLHHG